MRGTSSILSLLVAACIVMLPSGCAYHWSHFTETVDANGVTTTEYKNRLIIPPASELDGQSAAMSYKWGGKKQSEIKVGQTTQGVDTTPQTQLVQNLFTAAGIALQKYIEGQAAIAQLKAIQNAAANPVRRINSSSGSLPLPEPEPID